MGFLGRGWKSFFGEVWKVVIDFYLFWKVELVGDVYFVVLGILEFDFYYVERVVNIVLGMMFVGSEVELFLIGESI